MNERERRLLYAMVKMARGRLIRLKSAKMNDYKPLLEYVDEASHILADLEDIYGSPGAAE